MLTTRTCAFCIAERDISLLNVHVLSHNLNEAVGADVFMDEHIFVDIIVDVFDQFFEHFNDLFVCHNYS